jgi:uncharacterized membrane protein
MNDKTDITVLVLRFIFGAILGGLLTLVVMILMAWLNIEIPAAINLATGGVIILLAAISATIWGDRFLMGFMKIFKIFRYFP